MVTFFSPAVHRWLRLIVVLVCVGSLLVGWFRGGLASIYLDTDLGRDLSELSNIWLGHIVWLGPHLSAGFPASPIYYYLFFPILWLSSGQAEVLVFTNLGLAALSLVIFCWLAIRKYGYRAILGLLWVGFMPWFGATAIHPGNGYTYAFWLFLGLVGMWFEWPLAVGGLFIGLAMAHHPAAVFVVPILFFEWWRRGHRWPTGLALLVSLAVPWTPIIAFEFITRGYLLRQWLTHPGGSLHWQVQLTNITAVFELLGLGLISGLGLWLLLTAISSWRLRIWSILSGLGLLTLVCLSTLPQHYLLGLTSIFSFILAVGLIARKWTILILILIVVASGITFWRLPTPPSLSRSIPGINQVVDGLLQTGQIQKNQKIAVVAAMTPLTEVPQADDYRFFLRMRGYQVLPVVEYNQADVLIMFIEQPQFQWHNWSTWEIDQANARQLQFETTINQTHIIIWKK